MRLGNLVFIRHKTIPSITAYGIIVKMYDSGDFYTKLISYSNLEEKTKNWARYGDCKGLYIKRNGDYLYSVIENHPDFRIKETSYVINTYKNIEKSVTYAAPYCCDRKNGTTESRETILVVQVEDIRPKGIRLIGPCTYALIDGKYGELVPGTSEYSLKTAILKARINKLKYKLVN